MATKRFRNNAWAYTGSMKSELKNAVISFNL